MRYLLDENLDAKTAAAMDAIAAAGDGFAHLLTIAEEGTADEDIPTLCRQHGFEVLVSANVKDFGAKKVIYQALLNEGVNVLVIRAGKAKLKIAIQLSILSGAYERVRMLFATANGPAMIRVTAGGAAELRTLKALEEEFAAGDRRTLP